MACLQFRKSTVCRAFLFVVGLGISDVSHAFFVDPARCAKDSLAQGPEVNGRMAWFKKCEARMYKMLFNKGEYIFNGTTYPRNLYVTYAVFDAKGDLEFPGDWKAPTSANESCDVVPDGYTPVGVCTSGCYAPDQRVLFENGEVEIRSAEESRIEKIITLAGDATMDHLATQSNPVSFLKDRVDAEQDLLAFEMQSGGKIEVTTEHPLLDGTGKMRQARSLKPFQDSLVKENGERDLIQSITPKKYFGKVYNVDVPTEDPLQQIVIAQGYMNGSLYYQSGPGVQLLNQLLFREAILPVALIKGESMEGSEMVLAR